MHFCHHAKLFQYINEIVSARCKIFFVTDDKDIYKVCNKDCHKKMCIYVSGDP